MEDALEVALNALVVADSKMQMALLLLCLQSRRRQRGKGCSGLEKSRNTAVIMAGNVGQFAKAPPCIMHLVLFVKGKLLKDTDTITTVGVEDGTTVHMAPIGSSAASAPSATSPTPASPLSASSPPTPAPTPTYSAHPGQLAAFDNAMLTLLGHPEDVAREAVTVLQKVVSNIHDHPMEGEFFPYKAVAPHKHAFLR